MTMFHLSTQAREDMTHKKISSTYPDRIFSEHWDKKPKDYCSVIQANLITVFKSKLDSRSPLFDLNLRSLIEE